MDLNTVKIEGKISSINIVGKTVYFTLMEPKYCRVHTLRLIQSKAGIAAPVTSNFPVIFEYPEAYSNHEFAVLALTEIGDAVQVEIDVAAVPLTAHATVKILRVSNLKYMPPLIS